MFFFFFFSLINAALIFLFTRAGIAPYNLLEIAIAAALIAKVVSFIDHWPWAQRFQKKALYIGILWKTALYWTFLVFIRMSVKWIGNFFQQSASIDWHLFWSIQIYDLLFLFIFAVFKELGEKLGAQKMKELFFQGEDT